MKRYQVNKDEKKEIVLEEPGEYVVELVGEGAEVEIGGVFVAGEKDRREEGITKGTESAKGTKKAKGTGVVYGGSSCEVKVLIVHKAGNTRAETVLKAVGKDSSYVKLDGKIVVEKNCPNVNSFLTEKVLLVGKGARAEAVPDLEIESDEVKCSHAATVTRIPEEQVFYLMSRGLSRGKAEELVVEGFLEG